MSISIYHIITAGFTNYCTAQFWIHNLQKCTRITCFTACSPCSCCTATSQHWSTCITIKAAANKLFYDQISSAITCTTTKAMVNKPFYNWTSSAITCTTMKAAVNKLFYNWTSSAITCIIMKAANKPFYNWTSSAITSQSSESGSTHSDSISIYHYSHVYKLKICSFIQTL